MNRVRTVLALASELDDTLEPVLDGLRERGISVLRFDTETFPRDRRIAVEFADGGLDAVLADDEGSEHRLEDVDSVWYRHPRKPIADPALSERGRAYAVEESRLALEGLWRALEGRAFWVSRPRCMKLSSYRIHQLRTAQRVGLTLPHTLVTNDPSRVERFVETHPDGVIAKSVGVGVPTLERDDYDFYEVVFTHELTTRDLEEHLGSVRHAPTIFQERIPKEVELRITVVGDRVFGCAMDSQSHDDPAVQLDWRRVSPAEIEHQAFDLPEDVESLCRRLVRTLGLAYGAIDMILTPEGEHVFLEINCDGQYGWIEHFTDLPITEALVNLLASGGS